MVSGIRFSLAVSMIAVLAGISIATLIMSGVIVYEINNSVSNLEVKQIWLMPAHDGAEFNIVQGEILMTVDRYVKIVLAGDIMETRFSSYDGQIIQSGDGYIIAYSGPLQLMGPKTVGDEVRIQINHGGSMTEAVAVVEGV